MFFVLSCQMSSDRIHTSKFSSHIQLYPTNRTTSPPKHSLDISSDTVGLSTVLNSEFFFVASSGKLLVCWPSIPLHSNYWCAGVFLRQYPYGFAVPLCTFCKSWFFFFFGLPVEMEITGFPKPHQPAVDVQNDSASAKVWLCFFDLIAGLLDLGGFY